MRMDQVKLEITEEQLLPETGPVPRNLASLLSHLARLSLTNIPDTILLVSSHGTSVPSSGPNGNCPLIPVSNASGTAGRA
jgi:hypothetical protein